MKELIETNKTLLVCFFVHQIYNGMHNNLKHTMGLKHATSETFKTLDIMQLKHLQFQLSLKFMYLVNKICTFTKTSKTFVYINTEEDRNKSTGNDIKFNV